MSSTLDVDCIRDARVDESIAQIAGRLAGRDMAPAEDIWRRSMPVKGIRLELRHHEQLLEIYFEVLDELRREVFGLHPCPRSGLTKPSVWRVSQEAAASQAVRMAMHELEVAPVDILVSCLFFRPEQSWVPCLKKNGIDPETAARVALVIRASEERAESMRMRDYTSSAAQDLLITKKTVEKILREDTGLRAALGGRLGYHKRGWKSAEAVAQRFNVDRRLVTREAKWIIDNTPDSPDLHLEVRLYAKYTPGHSSYFLSPDLAKLVRRNLIVRRLGIDSAEYVSDVNQTYDLPADTGGLDKKEMNALRREYRRAYPLRPPVRYPVEGILRVTLLPKYYLGDIPEQSELEFLDMKIRESFARTPPEKDHITLPEFAASINPDDPAGTLSLVRNRLAHHLSTGNAERLSPSKGRRKGGLIPQDYYERAVLEEIITPEVRKVLNDRERVEKEGLISIPGAARKLGMCARTLANRLKAAGEPVVMLASYHADREYPHVKWEAARRCADKKGDGSYFRKRK